MPVVPLSCHPPTLGSPGLIAPRLAHRLAPAESFAPDFWIFVPRFFELTCFPPSPITVRVPAHQAGIALPITVYRACSGLALTQGHRIDKRQQANMEYVVVMLSACSIVVISTQENEIRLIANEEHSCRYGFRNRQGLG